MVKRMLIVDDSKTTRTMVAFALRRAGYEVAEAEDAQVALSVTSGSVFDCVITDINMPGMDGIELIRQLRASAAYKTTPILMLTTASDERKKQEGQSAGATSWIGKPFHPDNLIEAVAKFA